MVFGTHNIGSLPTLLERSRIEEESQVEIKESLEHFPSTLPSRRHSAFSAWVSISVGCNNTCTFCIVPQLRGPEKDREEIDIVKEAQALVDQGVIEITLLGIIERVRKAIPNSTITTDIIVGFPGEREEDFQETLSIMEEVKFLAAYSFRYSKRPGTPAATMDNQISDEVMRDRYERLHKLQQKISAKVNQEIVGRVEEILVADIDGAKATGRTKDFRLTHVAIDPANPPRPGDFVTSEITSATANFILADQLPISIRKTVGGDATQARANESTKGPLMMGMPSLATLKEQM